jgi:predicted GNAT superfamily acetyltransferase
VFPDIRPLTTIDDFAACVELQRAAFGWAETDLVPIRAFVVTREVGGLVLGAVAAESLLGFVSAVPGHRQGAIYWHSQMMCVAPGHQNTGIGTRLKMAQRAHALQRGVRTIHWAFDPLVPRNAYLNLAKLGAVIRRYSIDHYGATGKPLAPGLDSDRVIAEWTLNGAPPRWGCETRRVALPCDLDACGRIDAQVARAIQSGLREQFLRHFADGFVVTGCERHERSLEYVFRAEAAPGPPAGEIR